MKNTIQQIEDKLVENNLIFSGINEDPWEKVGTTYEKIQKVLSNTMTGEKEDRLDKAKKIKIINEKRIGRYNQQKGRPISVKFSNRLEMEKIMENKKKLGKGVYVDYEYAQETECNCKLLRPILKAAHNIEEYKGLCKLEGNTLTIKGVKYSTNTIGKLPANINGFSMTCKTNEHSCAFFGELHPFSNFHPCPISVDGVQYHCSKQFIQSEKARHYNDVTQEQLILGCESALEAKQLVKLVSNESGPETPKWNEVAKDKCK